MVDQDPGAPSEFEPEYEYDWQNPDRKTFDFGRTFSRAMTILKTSGVQMLILSFIFMFIPLALISAWPAFFDGFQTIFESGGELDWSDFALPITVMAIGLIISIIASLWLMPALIRTAYDSLTNTGTTIGSSIRGATPYVLPVLGFTIVYYIGVFVGIILLVIPGIFIALGWMLGYQIIVLEGSSVGDSFGRSWTLSKGSKRWLLLLSIVFGIIGAIIGGVLSVPIYFMGDPNLAMIEGASMGYWIFNAVLTSLSQVIGTVIGVAWTTAAYVEIRKVNEGVDPQTQADIFN